MDPFVAGLWSVVVLAILLVIGVRIGFATALVGIVGLIALRGIDAAGSLSVTSIHGHMTSYSYMVLPLFVLMGFLAFYAGITRDLFHMARQWLGHLPGGLALATIFGSAGFAAASGASTASVAVIGRMAIPELTHYGYDRRISAGCVAAGGTLAAIIPPAVLLVVYAFIAEESVGKLLMAGILPGLLSVVGYAGLIIIRFKLNPSLGSPLPKAPLAIRLSSLKGVWGISVLVLIVMGSIYTGVATPTEAAGLGAMGAFLLALPRLSRGEFFQSLKETATTSAMVFGIIAGTMIYVHFLGFTGMPAGIANWVSSLDVSPTVILLAILLLFLCLGMFLDGIGMMLLTVPILLPTVSEIGINLIVFGILTVRMIEIGLVTPPVGMNVFILSGAVKNLKMSDIFRGCGWFVVVDILIVALLVAFPEIITFIPDMMID